MKTFSILSLALSSVVSHMALTEPAPRRSPNHPGYRGGIVDFDITSPLGGGRSFPCQGKPKGPYYKSYSHGSIIKTHIAGSAKHSGGHCQFSVTYDEKTFVVLKTIMGTCLIQSVDYDIKIPNDAPSGNVTFIWTWFNKVGNREIYMNCADIEIKGNNKNSEFKGPEIVVANLPGYPTFKEGFENDYAKELYEKQPIVSISPKRY